MGVVVAGGAVVGGTVVTGGGLAVVLGVPGFLVVEVVAAGVLVVVDVRVPLQFTPSSGR